MQGNQVSPTSRASRTSHRDGVQLSSRPVLGSISGGGRKRKAAPVAVRRGDLAMRRVLLIVILVVFVLAVVMNAGLPMP